MKNVTIIGGSGARNTLKALSKIKGIKINNIVTMFDSGGSTGYLRKKFGVYAIGDLRDRLLAVSGNKYLRDISTERFEIDGVNHNIGNLILYNLIKKHGDNYLNIAKEMFKTPKNIEFTPITDDINCKANLRIKTNNGDIFGEDGLDSCKKSNVKILDVKLDRRVKISKSAAEAIEKADFLIFGPGDIYSSILPNTLVDGFYDSIKKSGAKKILIVNIMNKYPESTNFRASEFVDLFEKRGLKMDYVIVNDKILDESTIKGKYTKFSGFVENDIKDRKNAISIDLVNRKIKYEHDYNKLSHALKKIF